MANPLFSGQIFRLVTWSLIIPIVLFYVLSLVGCISTSPGIPDIYLLKMQDNASPTEVRVGYFGMCATAPNAGMKCQPSFSFVWKRDERDVAAAEAAKSDSTIFDTTDPILLRLLELGHETQVKVIFFVPVVLASTLFFLSASMLVIWRNIPNMSPMMATVAFMMHNLALALLLAAATAVSMVINALHFAVFSLTKGVNEINISGGVTLQTLQWMTVVFSVVFQVLMLKRYKQDSKKV